MALRGFKCHGSWSTCELRKPLRLCPRAPTKRLCSHAAPAAAVYSLDEPLECDEHECTVPERAVDVLVLGGGIIGLACATAVLAQEPDARVALLEAGPALCSGATGAGQGCALADFYCASPHYQVHKQCLRLCGPGLA